MRFRAFFLVVTNLGGAGASLYAIGYGEHEEAPGRVLPVLPGVPRRHESRRARRRRLHLPAGLGVHVAVVLGAGDGAPPRRRQPAPPATSTSSWRASARSPCCSPSACSPAPTAATPSPPSAAPSTPCPGLVLLLMLVGAGSKAGLVPLHVWLPLAHPAAPSHVSALMSGVMTKVAVYGFVRVVFDLLGSPGWWWSMHRAHRRRHHRRARRAQRPHAARPEAAARLSARSRTSASSSSASGSRSPSRPTA